MHCKEVLAEFIYKLDKENKFKCKEAFWSAPVVGFWYNNSLPRKFLKDLKDQGFLSEGINAVICILGDWESVAQGIIFTDRAIYVNTPKNKDKSFKIRYDEIKELCYLQYIPELQIKTNKGTFCVTTDMWSKRNIHDFLQFATQKYEFDTKNINLIYNIYLNDTVGADIKTIAKGNIDTSSVIHCEVSEKESSNSENRSSSVNNNTANSYESPAQRLSRLVTDAVTGRCYDKKSSATTVSKNDVKKGSGHDSSPNSTCAGITYGNVSNASSLYFDDKITSPRGHGFAAEHANHLADIYMGEDAVIVGDNNAKNGADRVVNGTNIQSKYCSTGSRCVQECFEGGTFRYWNSDGTPMQIEVPSDMYESAIQAMENRIRNGEISGITDPTEAKNIIRKGHFTYNQVKNIAKSGTIESICYDAASGAIIAANAFGITAILSFATAIWNGDNIDVALKSAAAQGLKVCGTTFVTAVLAGQLSKLGLNSALIGSSEALVRIMGPKASAVLVNAFRSGTNIYGAAAMKSASKLLRGNAITGAVTFVVLSIGDVGNIFQGRISGGQLFKNLTNTASSVAGGGAGWVAGAAAGAAIGSTIPGVGTAIGGVVGGIAGALGGGTLASKATGAVLDQFIEDDADRMVAIIQNVFADLAQEYLTTQNEAERIADNLKARLTGSLLKDMYASVDRNEFARDILEEYFKDELYNRQYIRLPSQKQMQEGLKSVLEDIADEEGV